MTNVLAGAECRSPSLHEGASVTFFEQGLEPSERPSSQGSRASQVNGASGDQEFQSYNKFRYGRMLEFFYLLQLESSSLTKGPKSISVHITSITKQQLPKPLASNFGLRLLAVEHTEHIFYEGLSNST